MICLILPVAIFFTACGDKTPEVNGIYLKRLDKEGEFLSYEYEYGDMIDAFDENMKLYVRFTDGKSRELTIDEYAEMDYVYTVGDEERHTISTRTVLDVGTYDIKITYKTYEAHITIGITQADVKNINYRVGGKLKTAGAFNYNSFTYKYGSGYWNNQEVGEGTVSTYVSSYEIAVLNTSSQQVDAQNISGVYCLTKTEKTEYNNISVLNPETSEFDETLTFKAKQKYLEDHTVVMLDEITSESRNISINGQKESDKSLTLYTENLKPGTYYAFALINEDNYKPFYTAPSTSLTVAKGDFVLKDHLIDTMGEWSGEEIIQQLDLHAEYTFGQDDEYKMNNGTTKALTLGYLNELASLNTWNHIIKQYDESDFYKRISTEIMGGGTGGVNCGHFEFKYPSTRVDATNSGQKQWITFVLDEYYAQYFQVVDSDYQIVLTINKAQVNVPNVLPRIAGYDDDGQPILSNIPEYEYDFGNTISLAIEDFNTDLVNKTGTLSATGVNTYTVTFALKDSVNYEFYNANEMNRYYGEENQDGSRTFTWKIVKLEQPAGADLLLGGEYVSTIYYNGPEAEQYELELWAYEGYLDSRLAAGDTLAWEIVYENEATSADLTLSFDANATGKTNTLTLSTPYTESTTYEKIEHEFYLNVNKFWTSAELETIYGETGEVPAEERVVDGDTVLYAKNGFEVRKVGESYYIQDIANLIPESSLDGEWTLYFDYNYTDDENPDNNAYVNRTFRYDSDGEIANGDYQITEQMIKNGLWRFEYNKSLYDSICIYVDTEDITVVNE